MEEAVRTEQDIGDLRDAVQGVLKSGEGKILIVGGRDGNFPREVMEHPQIVVWETTDPKDFRNKKIPQETHVVVFTRFMSHKLLEPLRNALKTRPHVKIFPGVYQTGQIRSALNGLCVHVAIDEAPEQKGHASVPYEPLQDFVRAHAQLDVPHPSTEIERIVALAGEMDREVNKNSVGAIFYKLRRQHAFARASEVPAANEVPPPVVEVPPPALTPVEAREERTTLPSGEGPESPSSTPPQSIPDPNSSIEYLEESVDQLGMLALAIAEVASECKRLRRRNSELEESVADQHALQSRIDELEASNAALLESLTLAEAEARRLREEKERMRRSVQEAVESALR